jgi:hypothetical protein
VAFDRQADAAVFADHDGAMGLARRHVRNILVGVDVEDVRAIVAGIEPAAGLVDHPARIQRLDRLGRACGSVLAPAFVVDHPGHDGRMVVQVADHAQQSVFELVADARGNGTPSFDACRRHDVIARSHDPGIPHVRVEAHAITSSMSNPTQHPHRNDPAGSGVRRTWGNTKRQMHNACGTRLSPSRH